MDNLSKGAYRGAVSLPSNEMSSDRMVVQDREGGWARGLSKTSFSRAKDHCLVTRMANRGEMGLGQDRILRAYLWPHP